MSRRPASDGLPRITRRIEVRLSPPFGGEDFPDMPMSERTALGLDVAKPMFF